MDLCSTFDLDEVDTEGEPDRLDEVDSVATSICREPHASWLTRILTLVHKNQGSSTSSRHENLYYSPYDLDYYIKLFSKICLWGNVMNTEFKSTAVVATSSDVESSFRSLKHGILMTRVE